MTGGSVDQSPARAPVLVLGLGNLLLGDDAAGLRLLAAIAREGARWGDSVEFVDGGTQGLALLGQLSGRRAAVFLDAVGLGAQPGMVHVLRPTDLAGFGATKSATAHEGGALELLALARLLGEEPEQVAVVGIEPESIRTSLGLSSAVERAIPEAVAVVSEVIARFAEEAGHSVP